MKKEFLNSSLTERNWSSLSGIPHPVTILRIPAVYRLSHSGFTPTEVEEFRQIGLDLSKIRHQDDVEQEVSRWANTLAYERFDLLEKIASEMAKVKGIKLPPKLRIVRS